MCRIRFRPEAPEPETNGADGKKPKKQRKARGAPLLGTSSSMLAIVLQRWVLWQAAEDWGQPYAHAADMCAIFRQPSR